jgi:hypothetical protein
MAAVPMFDVKLTKISSSHNNLRTNDVTGKCHVLPQVGTSFTMFAEGLEFGTRIIATSEVKEVTPEGFKTENSEYKLEVLSTPA